MADDGAMHSLLAAVAAAAASSASPSPSPPPRPPDPNCSPQASSPSLDQRPPPPPPPLPPPLPVPPPLPPLEMRRHPPPPPLTSPHPPQQKQQPQTQQLPSPHHPAPLPLAALPTLPAYEKKRKGARIFSAQEKDILEANYAKNKFPSRLHMETLGKALGKGTEKVRTWYNNRRATDRRQGIDVNRNSTDDLTSTPSSFPSSSFPSPSPLVEETVLLPSHVLANVPPTNPQPTPLSSSPKPPATPNPQTPSTAPPPPRTPDSRFRTATSSPYVNVTPSSISWAPSIANTPSNHYSPTSYPSNRFRISPLRIRQVCLSLDSHFLFGELPNNLQLDRGLEVKFLFGKKRVVYEWYCGHDYSLAQTTGGPYCKMEMSFASICDMHLFTHPDMAMLLLSFSLMPTLFLQTQQSMDKYKLRSQQRQYRRVTPSEFPIPVLQHNHAILLRSDEAIRTVKILLEDTPRLTSVLHVHNHKPFPILLPPVLQDGQNLSPDAPDASLPAQSVPIALRPCSTQAVTAATAQPQLSVTPPPPPALPPHVLQKGGTTMSSMACSTPAAVAATRSCVTTPCTTVCRRPLSVHELSSRPAGTRHDSGAKHEHKRSIAEMRHHAKTSVMETAVSKSEAGVKPSGSGCVKTPNAHAISGATSWRSPSTPFTRTSKLAFSGGADGIYNGTPLRERTNRRDTPTNGTRVRRELNFNGYGRGDTSGVTAYKRKANEMGGKENDERCVVRRKTVHVSGGGKANARLLAAGIPPPPLPPRLPCSRKEEGTMDNGGQDADKKDESCCSAAKDEGGALLQKLPR